MILAPDSPLRKPDVARLFVAYLLSYTGSAIAMAFGVLELTGSTREAAIVIAVPTLAIDGLSFGLSALLVLSLRPKLQRPLAQGIDGSKLGIRLARIYSPSLALPVYAVAACALVAGIGGQLFSTLWNTTLQQRIPGDMLSRVSAYDHFGSIALAPLGVVLAGFLFELVGSSTTLLLAAAIIIVSTAAVLLVADVRQMRASC